jgi:hypothetical protein
MKAHALLGKRLAKAALTARRRKPVADQIFMVIIMQRRGLIGFERE